MTKKEKTPEQKAKQAAAHLKWRNGEKGKAYYERMRLKAAEPAPAPAVSPSPWPFPKEKPE